MRRGTMIAAVFLTAIAAVSLPTTSEAQGRCSGCEESRCSSGYVYLYPQGSDIKGFWAEPGCYMAQRSCHDYWPCEESDDNALDVDAIEALATFGSTEEIGEAILRHPNLELVPSRGAISMRGCQGVLIGLLPIRSVSAEEVEEQLLSMRAPY